MTLIDVDISRLGYREVANINKQHPSASSNHYTWSRFLLQHAACSLQPAALSCASASKLDRIEFGHLQHPGGPASRRLDKLGRVTENIGAG